MDHSKSDKPFHKNNSWGQHRFVRPNIFSYSKLYSSLSPPCHSPPHAKTGGGTMAIFAFLIYEKYKPKQSSDSKKSSLLVYIINFAQKWSSTY